MTAALRQTADTGLIAVSWPPEAFLWSEVNGPSAPPGPLPPGLLPDAEEDFPLGDVHAVAVAAGEGRILVCAARRTDLSGLGARVVRLTPASLPPFAGGRADPRALNLLAGEFEPSALRRLRARRKVAASGLALALALLVAAGLWRRAAHAERAALRHEQAARETVRARLGDAEDPGALSAAVGRRRRLAEAGASAARPRDAAAALAKVLAALPAGAEASGVRVRGISVDQAAVRLAATTDGDAAPWLRAFRPPPGWTMDEPRLAVVDRTTRVDVTFRPGATSPDAAGAHR